MVCNARNVQAERERAISICLFPISNGIGFFLLLLLLLLLVILSLVLHFHFFPGAPPVAPGLLGISFKSTSADN